MAVLTALSLVVGLVLAMPASANMTIDFDFDSVIRGEEGSVTQLAERTVDADDVGQTCLMAAVAENQVSVHPGNDLIVSTGDSQAVILGVEDEANGGTSERYAITLGDTVVVQLRFGPDAISSLGFTLDLDCDTPVDQFGTVTTIVPTTVTPPSTEATTTLPVVEGCVTSGAGVGGSGSTDSACPTTTTCQALVSVDDQGTAAAIEGGCQPTTLCADGTVAIPIDGSGSSDGCATATTATTTTTVTSTTQAPAQAVCDDGSAPVQVQGQNDPVCPQGLAVTDLPETPTAQPVVAAPAYTG
jgi:hypothetical protein